MHEFIVVVLLRYCIFVLHCLVLFFVLSSIYISAIIWPGFFDNILLADKSRLRHMQITTNYSVNQEQHLYMQQLHIIVAILIGIVAVIATGTMLIAYIQHACGIFKIAR